MNRPWIRCRFMLSSPVLSPTHLDAHFGQASDKSWNVGDPRATSPTLKHERSAWILREDGGPPEGVEDVLGRLLVRVRPLVDRGIPDGWTVEVACEVMSDEGFPSVHFSSAALEYLAGIGSSLDVDILG